jgi:pilus assembly protein CpaE
MVEDITAGNAAGGEALSRPNRLSVLAFVADPQTEQVLRGGLGKAVENSLEIRRGNIRTAITAMTKGQTPEVLIIDISGEKSPMQALGELADVVEPGVRMFVIGDIDDVDFYRHIIRDFGVTEYIFKPINREAVARHFLPMITHKTSAEDATRGGRVVAVIGARGGVGATTIAGNLAWYLGMIGQRHTVFVDADLYMGSGAMLLGGTTSPGLRMALENPELDPLFVEHAAQPIADRLHILASDEKLQDPLRYVPGSAQRLMQALQARYNFIVLDLPYLPVPSHRELLNFAHHRVVVMDPSLASVRDALRLLSLPQGPSHSPSSTLVLNRQGRPGSLTRKQIEDALNTKIDVFIPDVPKQFEEADCDTEPAVSRRGPFREAIILLSQAIGFVGALDEIPEPVSRKAGFAGLFRRRLQQRG